MHHKRSARASLVLLALLALSFLPGMTASKASAASSVHRVFGVYADGEGEQQFTFLDGVNDPFGQTSPTPCGGGKIVFEMSAQIWKTTMSGGPMTSLEPGYWPACSPDGTQIAFTGGSNYYPFVMNVDGTNVRQLSNTERAYHLAWSKDGTKLAFDIFYTGPAANVRSLAKTRSARVETIKTPQGDMAVTSVGVRMINADGTGEASITNYGGHPSFSPDGKKVAFESGHGGISAITLATGHIEQFLLDAPVYTAQEPNWGSNGLLAYTSYLTGTLDPQRIARSEIWTYDTTGYYRDGFLTAGALPAWSPDGAFVAFARESNQTNNGGAVTITSNGAVVEGTPAKLLIQRGSDLSTPVDGVILFKNGTAFGSSTPGSQDFDSLPVHFHLDANQSQLVVSIPTKDDVEVEDYETFKAYLTNVSGGHLEGGGVSTVGIYDNDLSPNSIVEPPASVTPTIYSTPVDTGFEVALPATDELIFFSVALSGTEVFSRTAPATNVAIGLNQSIPADEVARVCVWADLTANGCPGMLPDLQILGSSASYTLTVTFQGRSATRQFTTNFEPQTHYYVYLPLTQR